MENDYEKKFRQDLQNESMLELSKSKQMQKQLKTAWTVAVILGCLLLVMTVVFSVVMITTRAGGEDYDDELVEENVAPQDFIVDVGEEYDEEGAIIALQQNCTADDGAKYTFDFEGNYQLFGADGNSVEFGKYRLVNSSLVVIGEGESEQVLYYDGYSVAKGLKLYYCDGEEQVEG